MNDQKSSLRTVLGGFVIFFAGVILGGYVVWAQQRSENSATENESSQVGSALPAGSKSAPVFETEDLDGPKISITYGTKSGAVFAPGDFDGPGGSGEPAAHGAPGVVPGETGSPPPEQLISPPANSPSNNNGPANYQPDLDSDNANDSENSSSDCTSTIEWEAFWLLESNTTPKKLFGGML